MERAPSDESTVPGISLETGRDMGLAGKTKEGVSPAGKPRIAVRIEYQHPPLWASKHACIPFRITNEGDQTIKEIGLSFESKAFSDTRQAIEFRRQVDLKPRSHDVTRQCDFFVSSIDGFYRLGVRGFHRDGKDRICAFRGSKTLIIRGVNGEKPAILVKDGGVLSSGAIDIDEIKEIIVSDGGVLDVEKLRGGNWRETDQWIGIDLFEDIEQTQVLLKVLEDKKRERIGKPEDAIAKPESRKALPQKALLHITDNGSHTVCIWRGRECLLGRSDKHVDLSLVLLPHTQANAKRNSRISRVHCRLIVEKNGVKLEDCGSTNGTFLDGCRLETPKYLSSNQVISLANEASFLYLDFRSIEKTREVRRTLDSCRTVMDCGLAFSTLEMDRFRKKAPLDAFVLKRQDGFANRLEYLFLVNSALIGASQRAAVRIYHTSVSERHARLLLIDGHYAIEDLDSEAGTFVNGKRLSPFKSEVVEDGAILSFGKAHAIFQIPRKG